MEDLICYCFNYYASDIERDVVENQRSTIMEKILSEKRSGGCQCATKNPKGRWCLVDVRQVVDKVIGRGGNVLSRLV